MAGTYVKINYGLKSVVPASRARRESFREATGKIPDKPE
jgi:hypothetical protein